MNKLPLIGVRCRVLPLLRIFLVAFLLAANVFTIAEQSTSDLIIVGVKVNGQNQPDWDVYKTEDTFLVSLKDIEKYLNIQNLKTESNQIVLQSPLGIVTIPLENTIKYTTADPHISVNDLLKYFKIRTDFNQAEYSLLFSIPWSLHTSNPVETNTPASIDFAAPSGSFSFIRFYNDTNYRFSDNTFIPDSTITMGGSVISGSWLLRLNDEGEQEPQIRDLLWNTDYHNTTHRFGTNYSNLSPLLQSFNYTGIQSAWTNAGISSFTDFDLNPGSNSFLTDDVALQHNISRTDGPPAGIAALKIDGNTAALVRISLDGHYEFRNIQHRQKDHQQIEIFLYEHNIAEQPKQVINLSRHTADLMLGDNKFLLRGGFGLQGNAFDTQSNTRDKNGFILFRFGLTSRVTLQFAAQANSDKAESYLAGIRNSIGKHWALGIDTSKQTSKYAMNFELSGAYEKWNTRLSGVYYQSNYPEKNESAKEIYDVRFNTYWNISDRLKAGIFARSYRSESHLADRYLLPGVFGKINNYINYYIHPDIDGDYQSGVEYFNGKEHRLTLSHQDTRGTTLVHSFYPSQWQTWQAGVEWSRSTPSDQRLFAQLDIYPYKNHRNFVQIGLHRASNKTGGHLSWNSIVKPGIELQLQYDHNKGLDGGTYASQNIWLRTKFNFAKTGRKLVPTNNNAINFSRGGISGIIVDQQGKRLELSNLRLNIDGKRSPQTSHDGQYFISDLKPGIYNISLDEENLPIEFNSAAGLATVEVKASAVTNVDLTVHALYGFSGQVKDTTGQPIANVPLTVLDHKGNLIRQLKTDVFGYYRLDELPTGNYRIHAKTRSAAGIRVNLTNDYLFDQNIVIANI